MKRTLGYWFYIVAGMVGGREDRHGPRPEAMFVLAMWFSAMLMAFLLAFSEHVFDIVGMYVSLWPPAEGFRNPANPFVHIGMITMVLGLFLGYWGYRYLIDNRIGIPRRRRSLKDFIVFMMLCFWPLAVLIASIRLGGALFQTIVHAATIALVHQRAKRALPPRGVREARG